MEIRIKGETHTINTYRDKDTLLIQSGNRKEIKDNEEWIHQTLPSGDDYSYSSLDPDSTLIFKQHYETICRIDEIFKQHNVKTFDEAMFCIHHSDIVQTSEDRLVAHMMLAPLIEKEKSAYRVEVEPTLLERILGWIFGWVVWSWDEEEEKRKR